MLHQIELTRPFDGLHKFHFGLKCNAKCNRNKFHLAKNEPPYRKLPVENQTRSVKGVSFSLVLVFNRVDVLTTYTKTLFQTKNKTKTKLIPQNRPHFLELICF